MKTFGKIALHLLTTLFAILVALVIVGSCVDTRYFLNGQEIASLSEQEREALIQSGEFQLTSETIVHYFGQTIFRTKGGWPFWVVMIFTPIFLNFVVLVLRKWMAHILEQRKKNAMNQNTQKISRHLFVRITFILGMAWGIFGLIVCYDTYRVDEEELTIFFVPMFIMLLPTFWFYFLSSRLPEIAPGFIGLYFKRKRLEEESRISSLSEKTNK